MQRLRVMALTSAILIPGIALAEPTLTVTAIDGDGGKTIRTFTSEDLAAFEKVVVVTKNDFVAEETRFEGPLLRDLITDGDIDRESAIAVTALDDYSTSIPADEVFKYDVIVALSMDGTPMIEEPQGPFWVIYPMSDNPELQEGYNGRLIWQLSKIEYVVPSND